MTLLNNFFDLTCYRINPGKNFIVFFFGDLNIPKGHFEIQLTFNVPLKRDLNRPGRYDYLLLFSNSESHTRLDTAIRLGSFWHLVSTLFVQKVPICVLYSPE